MAKTEITPDDVMAASPAYWATVSKVRLQSGLYSLSDHEYQLEPINSTAKRICFMKATQGGFTENEVLKSLHGMIYGRYPQGVLYMFPTADDVREFSKARFGPLITANKAAIGKFVKDTDTTTLKRVGESFLYLRGARLTYNLADSDDKESSKLRGIPVDRVVFDELDLMDESVIAKARGRMGHSKVGEEVYISNPSQEDYGIDLLWQKSDQRHWFRKCGCNTWTCAELSFPNCVKTDRNGRGFIGCDKCGKPLPIWSCEGTGRWIPAKPDIKELAGYRWSQLTSVFNDPAEILDDFTNPPEGNLGDVYRLRLGLPYSAHDDKLRINDVLACCGPDCMPRTHNGPCAMGVDVGKTKHYVIGVRTGNDRYELIRIGTADNFNEIHDLARMYNVRSAVIDLRPYEDEVRSFQRQERYFVALCEYSDSLISETAWNEQNGTVKVHRTGIFDASHRLITNGQVTIPRQCPEVKEFARQCCNTARFQEKEKRGGTPIFRYKAIGDKQEHYRSALNYFLLAAGSNRIAAVSRFGTQKREELAINDYDRI